MAFNSDGSYTPVAGAETAAAGNTIQSAVWNNINTDYATALQQIYQQLLNGQAVQNNILFGNGGCEIWQRGTSFSVNASTTSYTADRWYITTGANQAHTIAQATGITNNSTFGCKIQRNSGQTGVTAVVFGYPLDTESLIALRGKKVAIGFTIKAGANYSPANVVATLYTGTGTVAKRGAGFTNEVNIGSVTATPVASGSAVSATVVGTVTVPLTATAGELQFAWTPVGTAGVDDSFTIDDVFVNPISDASTWLIPTYDRVPFSIALADCAQHYWKTFPYATSPAQNAGTGGANVVISQANARNGLYVRFPRTLRDNPAVTTYNPSGASANWQDVTTTVSIVAAVTATSSVGVFIAAATVSATDHFLYLHMSADAGI